jgi:hypothetical protein
MRLEAPAVRKPRLLRRRRGQCGAAGLEDLLESYLNWSLAESDNLIAELRRRQIASLVDAWVAELCCGDEWARREAALSVASPWEILIKFCNETGLGLDSYVKLSQDDEREIVRLANSRSRAVLPDLWVRIGPAIELVDDEYDALDEACIEAYETLSKNYRSHGQFELAAKIEAGDPSADTNPERWNIVLGRVKAEVEFHPLAELLLPTDTARGLMALDASAMSLDELSEELIRWVKGAQRALAGSIPASGALNAIMALWTEPEIAVSSDWRGSLEILIAERPVARAARYLALKGRAAKRGGTT